MTKDPDAYINGRPGVRSVNWLGHYFQGIDRRRELDLLKAVKGSFCESANHGYRFTRFEYVFVTGDTKDLSKGARGLALGDFGTLR